MPAYRDTYNTIGSNISKLTGTLGDVGGSSSSKLKYMNQYAPQLQQTAQSGSQALEQARKLNISDINQQKREAITGVRERMAQQGLVSPLGVNVENRATANAENAITRSNVGFAQQQEQAKLQAMSQLFGIDQAELQSLMNDRSFYNQLTNQQLNIAGMQQQDYWNQKNLDQRNSESWGGIVGNLVGTGAKLFGGAMGWI